MRFIGLGTRGGRRASGDRTRSRLLALGLGALALGALIGLGWTLADTGSRAEAAESPEGRWPTATELIAAEVTGVLDPLDLDGAVEETTRGVAPTAAALLGDEPAAAVAEVVADVVEAPETVVKAVTAAPPPAETRRPPALLQTLTAALGTLTGPPHAPGPPATASGHTASVPEAGTIATENPTATRETADEATVAPPPADDAPKPTSTTAHRAEHAPPGVPGGPLVPFTPCPADAGTAGGTSAGRCHGGGHHGVGAVPPTTWAWHGQAPSGALPAAGAQTPPAGWVAEYTVAPD